MRTTPQPDIRAGMNYYVARSRDQRARRGQPLTDTETDILARLAAGASDQQILRALNFSARTFRRHLAAAKHKLGARSRVHAVVLAAQAGLIRIVRTPDA